MILLENRGLLIAIEGIDGSGKSTQATQLSRLLEGAGFVTEVTREPTAGQYGLELRRSARAGRLPRERELELFMLDRKEHVEACIEPALQRGEIVITDRYYFSTVAYQGARGFEHTQLLRDNEAIAPKPDLLCVIDLPVQLAVKRIEQGRQETRTAFEQTAMLTTCRDIFLGLAETTPCGVVIDGEQSPELITQRIAMALLEGPLSSHLGRLGEADREAVVSALLR